MQVLHVTRYNAEIAQPKWNRALERWKNASHPKYYPCRGMYFFVNIKTAENRKTGYVAFDDRTAILRKTKKQAIKDYRHETEHRTPVKSIVD